MDTTPIYELRERLRAAAIAGTDLLSEDFRLRRAYETFQSLETASPVFAKVGQMTERLLSPDCQSPQGALLDTISLVDAVVCTLAAAEGKGEVEPLDSISMCENAANRIVNAPCSKVKALIEALTTSGSGNYLFVRDMHTFNPEIFSDYRVRYAMVQALGASYAELAEMVKVWLAEEGETIIPLLKKEFDPKGKKSMVRRVWLIEHIAGAAENDFYTEMLETATGEVRSALIETLRHEPSNINLLLDMQKTEKGKNKQLVLNMLAMMEDERCYGIFHELAEKKQPSEVFGYLLPSTTDCASRVIVELCERQLSDLLAIPQAEWGSETADQRMGVFGQTIQALVGKHGEVVCAFYRRMLLQRDILGQISRRKPVIDVLEFPETVTRRVGWPLGESRLDALGNYSFPTRCKDFVRSKEFTWEVVIGRLMAQSLIVYPDEDLMKMVLELYEKDKNINFLTAAAVVKILGEEDCTGWLDESAAGQAEQNELERAFVCFSWNRKIKSYVVDMRYQHRYDDCREAIFRKEQIPHAREITDWMLAHRGGSTDAILNRWINTTDTEQCEKYGRYFYERASAIVDNEEYLRYMRNCGWKQCKGLGTDYAKTKVRSNGFWILNDYLHNLPGDAQAILEETSAVADLVRSGEVELDTPESVEAWADQLKDLSLYNALRDND